MHAELLKWYIILLLVAIVLYSIIESKANGAKNSRKTNLLYGLTAALLIGFVTFVGLLELKHVTLPFFITVQILVFILGLLHFRFLNRILQWIADAGFGYQFLYTLMICCLGAAVMLFCLRSLNLTEHYLVFSSSIIWFSIPLLFMRSFDLYSSMPEEYFKKWVYPMSQSIAPPADKEMTDLVVITFEFYKNDSDKALTIFRAKAPLNMPLGRLFYYFINDYNERHPDVPIEYSKNGSTVYEWLFYKKRKWYQSIKYLDFEDTVNNNSIRENSIIVCKRVN